MYNYFYFLSYFNYQYFNFSLCDIAKTYPKAWFYIKIVYCLNLFITDFLVLNSILEFFKLNKLNKHQKKELNIIQNNSSYNLLIGTNSNTQEKIYIPEKGLYQNILITGTIGSRKN